MYDGHVAYNIGVYRKKKKMIRQLEKHQEKDRFNGNYFYRKMKVK